MTRPAIIITGAAKRVGAAMALYLARAGYDIALHYHHSAADAKKTKAQIEALGAKCLTLSHNINNIKGIPLIFKKINEEMPDCVALVNNASIFERATLMETDEALFDRQMDVNFKAPFFATQAFAKVFGKGCVINMLDTGISKTQGSHFAYLLAKKTLAEFTTMAARELGPNVRVNGVCPGIVLPPDDYDPTFKERVRSNLPLKSHPSLEEIAEAVRWLIEQRHITGQIIFVDGGMHVV